MIKFKYKGINNMEKIKQFLKYIFTKGTELTEEEEQIFLKKLIAKIKEN